MEYATRRNFLQDLGRGAAAFSISNEGMQATQLPGHPNLAGTESPTARASNVMAIAAHPGDALFSMGATVASQVHIGAHGLFVSLSLGEKGSPSMPPAQYGPLQRASAEHAARLLGAEAVFLDYPDGEIPRSEGAKFAICDLIREFKPDVIVTHWRGSWHKDHNACHEIANDAVFYAGLPAVSRKRPAHEVRKVFYADNWEDAEGFTADTYLDVLAVFERWIEACAAFPMWRGENGFRYKDYYQSLAVQRGCLSGYKYAVALMSAPAQLVRRVPWL